METSPNHLLNCFRVLFSPKTLLLNITLCFVSEKELEKRGFKFFKLLVYLCDPHNIDFCNKWIGLHVCLPELDKFDFSKSRGIFPKILTKRLALYYSNETWDHHTS